MTTLTVRAQRILGELGVSTPQELHRRYVPRGRSVAEHLLRQPNCGRKTMKEIMEWGADGKRQPEDRPPVVYLRWVMEDGMWHLVGYSTDREMEGAAWVRFDRATRPTASTGQEQEP